MSQLMRKLDQLNLDIEEALSASSSPCDTPCTSRKKQVSVFDGFIPHTLIQTQNVLYVLCVIKQHSDVSAPAFSMYGHCHGWYCTHSCEAYAAYFVMLVEFPKSIYFALWWENPSGLFRPVSNRCSSEFLCPHLFFWKYSIIGLDSNKLV